MNDSIIKVINSFQEKRDSTMDSLLIHSCLNGFIVENEKGEGLYENASVFSTKEDLIERLVDWFVQNLESQISDDAIHDATEVVFVTISYGNDTTVKNNENEEEKNESKQD